MLVVVRRCRVLLFLLFGGLASVLLARQAQQPSQPQATTAVTPAPPAQALPPPAPPTHQLSVVVLDPGHGGADSGARGPGGSIEKDLVLVFARTTHDALQRQSFRVVMTREGDEDPSFDDRAAIANAQSDSIFVSFHVSSTGAVGTARAYSYLFSSAPAMVPVPLSARQSFPVAAKPVPPGFLLWNEAQKPYVDLSRRLADLIQVEISQKFRGSPELSSAVPVRDLRSVTEPAVAVEVSSVAADPREIEAMASALAEAITRGIVAFRPVYAAEAK